MGIDTSCCDKCGRSFNGKGYIEVDGWKICGICQFENNDRNYDYPISQSV